MGQQGRHAARSRPQAGISRPAWLVALEPALHASCGGGLADRGRVRPPRWWTIAVEARDGPPGPPRHARGAGLVRRGCGRARLDARRARAADPFGSAGGARRGADELHHCAGLRGLRARPPARQGPVRLRAPRAGHDARGARRRADPDGPPAGDDAPARTRYGVRGTAGAALGAVVEDQYRRPDKHAPTVGILLCTGKAGPVVRYSLASTAAPVAVADYHGLPADARAALPSADQLREALDLDGPAEPR